MQMMHCPNCEKRSGFKRALGFGTFFMVLITFGLWLLVIPLYPARCINCGTSRGEAVLASMPKWARVLTGVLLVGIVGLIVIGTRSNEDQAQQSSQPAPIIKGPDYNEVTRDAQFAELRAKCAPYINKNLEDLESGRTPLPPHKCSEVLGWMRDSRVEAFYSAQTTPTVSVEPTAGSTFAYASMPAQASANESPKPQQPPLTPHQQRLAGLREKQEGIAMRLLIERETINKVLREEGPQGVPEDEHERVQRLIQEEESIDAAIKEEEQEGGSEPEPSRPTILQTLPHHQMGETFSVGYWTYRCDAVRWSEFLGNGNSGMGRPDSAFAVIYLMMRNEDDSASTLPPLTLVDADAQEYEPSPKAVLQKDALDLGNIKLDPKTFTSGSVIFDVPTGRRYYLKVSGGYWSNKDALIDLATK
jgi:hypothetical protein